MGVVYRALNLDDGSTVALKRIPDGKNIASIMVRSHRGSVNNYGTERNRLDEGIFSRQDRGLHRLHTHYQSSQHHTRVRRDHRIFSSILTR